VLIKLDLSTAFDTVDHSLLIEHLQSEFRVTNTALNWLRSYLGDRSQFVRISQHHLDSVQLDVGVPQGSVRDPLLFAVCCSRWPMSSRSMTSSTISTLLQLSMHVDNTAEGLAVLAACTDDVRQWYLQNGL